MPTVDQTGAAGAGSFVDRGRWHDDMITVVVCDDHAQLAAGCSSCSRTSPTSTSSARRPRGEQGIATCRDLAPDVVIVGMRVESIGGPRTSAGLRELVPVAQVVMLVTPEDVTDAVRAVKAGATGFINREVLDQAPSVVRAVSAGVAALPPLVAGDLLRELDRSRRGPTVAGRPVSRDRRSGCSSTSPRGQSYAAAARALGVADFTAKNLAANLRRTPVPGGAGRCGAAGRAVPARPRALSAAAHTPADAPGAAPTRRVATDPAHGTRRVLETVDGTLNPLMGIFDKLLRTGEGKKLKALAGLVPDIAPSNRRSRSSPTTDAHRPRPASSSNGSSNGEDLDDLLPEAFAVVREAGSRTLGQRHFDVQLMGGAALHFGWVAEMKTGEGKTLVATLPVVPQRARPARACTSSP